MTIEGVLLLLAGIFLVVFPFASSLVVTAAIGMFLVAIGAVGLFAAAKGLTHGHGSVLAFVGPPLAMLVGGIFWTAPEAGLAAVMEIAGAITLVAGLMQIAIAMGMSGRMHWGLLLINGLLTVAAGLCMVAAPDLAVFVFAIFFGVQLAFHGGHLIRVGLRMKRWTPAR